MAPYQPTTDFQTHHMFQPEPMASYDPFHNARTQTNGHYFQQSMTPGTTSVGEFENRNYLTKQQKLCVAQKLQLPEYTIEVWFSNRRAKRNKEKNLRNKSLFGTMDSSLSNKELTSTEGSVTEKFENRNYITKHRKCVLLKSCNYQNTQSRQKWDKEHRQRQHPIWTD
ncbi:hypothetical protein CRE_03357 [Caenorhabditis remanei]|uniref:Uncharacterized protein n=1 Tax=Caenorhabditis remanei TaxID=31234 RepID=E3N642_CAERE|nr:hypothetical protein CRE_03357 [Caenorhabditis remanei]